MLTVALIVLLATVAVCAFFAVRAFSRLTGQIKRTNQQLERAKEGVEGRLLPMLERQSEQQKALMAEVDEVKASIEMVRAQLDRAIAPISEIASEVRGVMDEAGAIATSLGMQKHDAREFRHQARALFAGLRAGWTWWRRWPRRPGSSALADSRALDRAPENAIEVASEPGTSYPAA